ncbi:phage minor head protein [Streptomonospora litoralis]|uniref:Phage Mu protein F like protein n=1 Tax=Streptomonospora litoralis TaxID=2498135 RepID=A0A4V0ZKF8_9ACTN|nr:phage minor head protein [Streptomonospora litoralis]QBI56832.1 Phage Mu protein F like protein [Streptomonospora litoralis]
MAMPLPEPDDTTPDLNAMEEATREDIERHLVPAQRAAEQNPRTPLDRTRQRGRVARLLREARAALTDTATNAARQAVRIGAAGARTEAPPPDGREQDGIPDDTQTANLTADVDLRQDVRFIITTSGLHVETGPRAVEPALAVQQTASRVWNVTATAITRAHTAGRAWYAALFAYDLKWYTRRDERVCPICRPAHGRVIGSRERFTLREVDWEAFSGRPPAHFRCRCYAQVLRR